MMENTDKNIAYTPVATQNEPENTTKMQAIVEITQYYQEKTQRYSNGIQAYNLEIEKIKIRIDEAIRDKIEEEEHFSRQASEVKYHARIVGESNDTFHQTILSLDELETEYKESMQASEYMRIIKKKKQSIHQLLVIISDQEEQLLAQELERLNILEMLTPKRKELEALQNKLKTLELEKKHFESSQLQQVIQLPTLSTAKEEVIDIDTVDE